MFPLPLPQLGDLFDNGDVDASSKDSAVAYCQSVVVVSNHGYGCATRSEQHHMRTNAAQRAALRDFGRLAIELVKHLSAEIPNDLCDSTSWATFQSRGSEPILELVASLVDVPSCAGRRDPLKLIQKDMCEKVSSAEYMFGGASPGLEKFGGFYAGPFSEYVKLTVRMLKCGKLGLRSQALGGGTIFPVGKSGGKQREVFHGTRFSEACVAPPNPPHLANPLLSQVLSSGTISYFA